MPVIVQVCAVVVTIVVLVEAATLVRMAGRISKLTDDARLWIEEMQQVRAEARQVVASSRDMLKPVQASSTPSSVWEPAPPPFRRRSWGKF